MSTRCLTAFIDAMAAGRRPDPCRGDPEEIEILRAAIALRAARPGDAVPDNAFVAALRRSLAEETRDSEGSTGRLRLGRSRAVLVAVAASAALIGGTFVATEASNPATTNAAIGPPHGRVLRSATFETAHGQALGQIVVHGGSPGWVFMNVDVPTSESTVTCKLRMQDGSVVTAGRVDLHDGTGESAKRIEVDTHHLQGATLSSNSGAVVASVTFA